MVTLALIAYTADGVLRGAVDLDHGRLADLLAEGAPLQVNQAAVQAHADCSVRRLGRAEIALDELPVVVAAGPQGDPARRLAMTSIAVQAMVAGGYRILGRVHVPSGEDLSAIERQPWIAITGGVIAYDEAGRVQIHLHEVLLVNRSAIRSLVRCEDVTYEQEREAVFHAAAAPVREPMPVMRFARAAEQLPMSLA